MKEPARPKYERILLKLSGEAFKGTQEYGLHWPTVKRIAGEVRQTVEQGVEVAIVVGGGNIWRGKEAAEQGMDRATADYAGMLATVINALALQNALEDVEVDTRVQTAIEMKAVAEPFIRRRAIRHLEKGRVVIFGAGTGNPHFTTDTAGVLRAVEIGAEVIMKGTDVDGVYDKDPDKDPTATVFSEVSYLQVLNLDLKVIDATAVSLAREKRTPIIVFNMSQPGNIFRAAIGEAIGTMVG